MKLVPSTYRQEDCIYLLKDLTTIPLEMDTLSRETQMQGNGHYSETLPIEQSVSPKYKDLYYQLLNETKNDLASYINILAHKIVEKNGKSFVLVSLARGGTPIGALLSRYYRSMLQLEIPHYSISIIRGKGIDKEALLYIKEKYPDKTIQFVDGWTGKGAITKELIRSCEVLSFEGIYVEPNLACIADPGRCATISAIDEDFLLVNSLLNSTISGLISRTVLNKAYIQDKDFHGAKFYSHFLSDDETNHFLEEIEACFTENRLEKLTNSSKDEISFQGYEQVKEIAATYGVMDLNLIKPSLGEATRVLLRRNPWKLLIKDLSHPRVKHLLLLAEEKNVEVVEYPNMNYLACGIISQIGKE